MPAEDIFEPLSHETLSNRQVRRRGSSSSKIIKGSRVVVVPAETTSPKGNDAVEPYLDIRRSGDIVESIVVHCPCGRETVVVLEYGDNGQLPNP